MDRMRRTPARFIAPVALVAFLLALFVVISGSDVSEESDDGGGDTAAEVERAPTQTDEDDDGSKESREQTAAERRESELPDDFYTVKTGDTLAGIAQAVGIPVERLQELNPELDPQALVSGQKIKLKE